MASSRNLLKEVKTTVQVYALSSAVGIGVNVNAYIVLTGFARTTIK
jgi:hypothetical protein